MLNMYFFFIDYEMNGKVDFDEFWNQSIKTDEMLQSILSRALMILPDVGQIFPSSFPDDVHVLNDFWVTIIVL